MAMNQLRMPPLLAALAAGLLVACGGSGSTGLFPLEGALLAEVRETGECRDANATTYCPAVPFDEMGRPPAGPAPGAEDFLEGDTLFVFVVSDLPAGSGCAAATRTSDTAWRVGSLEPILGEPTVFAAVATDTIAASEGTIESALLCFETPPETLPEEIQNLSDVSPSIVFVAPTLA